ncbi:MAG: tyrosine-type recombinase/integrase [Burkholderiales bacterium]|nr:tyrosine-type recombinase/integrase [Burkholderiales bacterium]
MEQPSIKITLPRGIQLHGTNIRFDFTFDKKRYRVTTNLEAQPQNIEKATKLLISIKNDLEREQFYISNYRRMFTDIRQLEPLDINYAKLQQQKPMLSLLEQQLQRYELGHKNKTISYATLMSYKGVFKQHLIPYFENMVLENITSQIIEEFIASRQLSKKRLIVILTPLREILRRARKNSLISFNPFDELDKNEIRLHGQQTDYEVDPFNTTEKEAILKHATGQIKNFIQFAFWTGMRVGEIFALTWEDVDFENEIVHVNKAKSLGGTKSPKTKAGIREVELTPLALDALKAQIEYKHTNNIVFNNPMINEPWSRPNIFRRHWVKILEAANVKYRNPHQMRHTFISYMLMMGNRPEVLYRMVGHENTKTIYEVYGKFIKGEKLGKKLIV